MRCSPSVATRFPLRQRGYSPSSLPGSEMAVDQERKHDALKWIAHRFMMARWIDIVTGESREEMRVVSLLETDPFMHELLGKVAGIA